MAVDDRLRVEVTQWSEAQKHEKKEKEGEPVCETKDGA
jgi:hypothetical protein